jgi:nucleolar MIF4G domain-containing protein 1
VYFSHTSNTRKRGAEEELVESPQRKKLKPHGSNATTAPKGANSLLAQSVVEDIAPVATPKSTDASPSIKVSKKSTIATKGSALLQKKSSTVKLTSPEDKEDAYIAYLESKLGMDKSRKKKGKKVEEDGLESLDGTLQCFYTPYFDLKRAIGLDLLTRGAYVPPQSRNAQCQNDSNSEAIPKLTRQLKGLLNR